MKVNLTTLGCPKNLVDSEVLLGGLTGQGIQLVENALEAETIILNTCGFIQGAKEESIDAILQAVELKKNGRCKKVFVTGCLSQRYRHELQHEIPEVDGYFGNRDMRKVLSQLLRRLDLKREILGERLLTTPNHFAYLKISEGCENPCTFCAIPAIRGRFKSRTMQSLVVEAQFLVSRGVRELILVAQDSTIYGVDNYGEYKIVPLLDKLCDVDGVEWIRLLYTYPAHFRDDLIEFLGDRQEKINYVDMPIQHISDNMLRRMARRSKRKDIEAIIQRLRANSPNIAIRTTLISGFPGETEHDHEELLDFVEQTRFERLGIFAYSNEDDTVSFNFRDQLPDQVRQERRSELHDVQNQISLELNRQLIGRRVKVLIDSYDEESNLHSGRTSQDCPEIDNSVVISSAKTCLKIGGFYQVVITSATDYELFGEVTS